MPKNYYQILEVDKQASPEVIEKAYKALAMKYHPDKWPADKRKWATGRMQEINDAYKVLSDIDLRTRYDQRMQVPELSWEIFLEEGLLGLYYAWRLQK